VHRQQSRVEWARTTALRDAARRLDEQDPDTAFRLAERALAVDPDNSHLRRLSADSSRPASITSDPPGADVFVRWYRTRATGWRALGRTPIAQARVPVGLVKVRLTRDGFEPFHGASHWAAPFTSSWYRLAPHEPGGCGCPHRAAPLDGLLPGHR
jgi:hypothetical protein